MPEEGLETAELKEALEQANEHAHGGHGGEHKTDPWIIHLSLSTAIIAVLASIAALESGAYANHALGEKNDAVLAQSQADDDWAFYQAKGIKSTIYETQAQVMRKTDPELSEKFSKEVERYKHEQKEIEHRAKEGDEKVKEKQRLGEELFHTHHQFAYSVTIFQVSIAIAAIGALTKRKQLWYVSMLIGLAGLFFFVKGFLHH